MVGKFSSNFKIKGEVPMEKWAKLLPLQFKYSDQPEILKSLEITPLTARENREKQIRELIQQ